MRIRIDPDQFVPIAAAALMLLSMAACAFQLGSDENEEAITSPVSELDPFAAKLRRCQTVTSEQAAELEACRQVWAENRRRFMTSRKPNWNAPTGQQPMEPVPDAKYQDRALPSKPSPGPSEVR